MMQNGDWSIRYLIFKNKFFVPWLSKP